MADGVADDDSHVHWSSTSATFSGEEPTSPSEDDHDTPAPSGDGGAGKPVGPVQKRRRVTRACDECRRKKIKCDGKQPCTHCTVYSYGKPR